MHITIVKAQRNERRNMACTMMKHAYLMKCRDNEVHDEYE